MSKVHRYLIFMSSQVLVEITVKWRKQNTALCFTNYNSKVRILQWSLFKYTLNHKFIPTGGLHVQLKYSKFKKTNQ